MKTRIPSTIVNSVFVLINGFFMFFLLIPMDYREIIQNSAESIPQEENMGMLAMVPLLLVGAIVVALIFWMLAIAIMHAIWLIFSIRNRKSPIKAVRVISYVLDASNAILVLAPIIKIIVYRFT